MDRGLCHGLGLFETILAVNGKPCQLRRHLARLSIGLERFGTSCLDLDPSNLEKAVSTLLAGNGLIDGMARVRLAVSLGEGPLDRLDSGQCRMWITAATVGELKTELKAKFAPWRKNKESGLRGMKTASYAEHLLALDWARGEGVDEVIFFNTSDELCEAAMANVFLIKDGILRTPGLDSGCLAGVTREFILELAKENGIPCEVDRLMKKDLIGADGIFLSSSIRGPVFVNRLNEQEYEIHPLFHALRGLWMGEILKGRE
ncbi:MAG: aminotransferase class IV [Armatimonadetes bacterium]|nr:aminotransferase class IV [Akkermansiaceae bacterium]